MDSGELHFDVIESIRKHIELLKPWSPKQAIISVCEYPAEILLEGSFADKTSGVLPIFIDKSSEDIVKLSQSRFDSNSILGLDADIDTHFWFQVLHYITNDDSFMTRLRNKPVNKLSEAIIVSSLWDGVGSALLPALISQFKELNINSVALALLPSKKQPPDAQFNAFSSVGMCASKDFTPVLLVDRDRIESYVGVNRNGSIIRGNMIVNYILELMLAKQKFAQELSELSRSFNVKMYAVLSATGANFKIYGSLKNILDTALLRPLSTFDLSSVTVLYVLLRMPLELKGKLPRGKIELAITDWFEERASLKSVYVSDPIYVEDAGDRIDLVMFVGGFDVTKMFTSQEKKVSAAKSQVVKQGLIKEDEWKGIIKSLMET